MPNVDVVAKWLGAQLYQTTFRPVPLVQRLKVRCFPRANHRHNASRWLRLTLGTPCRLCNNQQPCTCSWPSVAAAPHGCSTTWMDGPGSGGGDQALLGHMAEAAAAASHQPLQQISGAATCVLAADQAYSRMRPCSRSCVQPYVSLQQISSTAACVLAADQRYSGLCPCSRSAVQSHVSLQQIMRTAACVLAADQQYTCMCPCSRSASQLPKILRPRYVE